MKNIRVILTCLILLAISHSLTANSHDTSSPKKNSETAAAHKKDAPNTSSMRLWYDKPAGKWLEALPIGNGRLGGMVFGGPKRERIQLNEESLWSGQPLDCNPKDALKHLPEIRRLLFEGDNGKANQLANKYLLGNPPKVRSYQTLGDLTMDIEHTGKVTNYRRELDLENGVCRATYNIGDVKFTHEAYISAVDDVLVLRISADQDKKVSGRISLARGNASVKTLANDSILLTGQVVDRPSGAHGPGGKHMKFAAMAKVIADGGTAASKKNGAHIESANTVTIMLTAATDYDLKTMDFDRSREPASICERILNKASEKDYATLWKTHVQEHSDMFNRVDLELGESPNPELPTDQQLQKLKRGGHDPHLVKLYFQFGRYLLMGCSRRPGRLPGNLQGIWNHHMNAPWGADYHTNINLQMNYWPATVCNLTETNQSLIDFVDRLRVPGRKTARKMYGADGWTMHHVTDVFGKTCVHDAIKWGMFPMGGPWMTLPLWRHYEFTCDREVLEQRIYPIMKESAQFVLDFLVEGPDGYLVTAPSYSPENTFIDQETGKRHRLTYAPTMDIEIIHALFERTIAAAEILERDVDFRKKLKEVMNRLPPLQIEENGTIQEWIKPYKEASPGHRHISHLLGLHPGDWITPNTLKLFAAARKTIERRLKHGGARTGWSRAWTISFFARLLDGDAAYHHLHQLLARSTVSNLFDMHPPFQIDGNFGGTAGVAEMLLQSHRGEPGNRTVDILPALPKAWAKGHVRGLLARGGFRVDIEWSGGKPTKIVVHSLAGKPCRINYNKTIEFDTAPGQTYVITGIGQYGLRGVSLKTAEGKKVSYKEL